MNFFHAHVSSKAVELALQALTSGLISEGELVRRFEQALASPPFGLVGPLAVNSGTSALHLALEIASVGPDDEVILPAQTFVASGMAILMCGAKPVFADIQSSTGNIDPLSVRAKITTRTKALMPVHWGGYPCDMNQINDIAREHGLAVVEDAAQAFGATYNDQPVGSLSRFTAFSFQAIKHLTTGDGGALCCLDESDYLQARRRRWFGIDRDRDLPSMLGERVYELNEIGFKYHMNDLSAAVGLGNLPDIAGSLARHREIAGTYREALAGTVGMTLLENKADRESACWTFTLLAERRNTFVQAMTSRGIPVSVVHQRIDRHPVFGGLDPTLTEQESFDKHQVALPVHIGMTDTDVATVIRAVRAGW